MRSLSILVAAGCGLALAPGALAQGNQSSPAKVKEKPDEPEPDPSAAAGGQQEKKVVPRWAFKDQASAQKANKGLKEQEAKKPPGGIKELKASITLVATDGMMESDAVKVAWSMSGSGKSAKFTYAYVPKKALEDGSGDLFFVDGQGKTGWPTYATSVSPRGFEKNTFYGSPVIYEGEDLGRMPLRKPDPAGNGNDGSKGQSSSGNGKGDGSGSGNRNGSGSGSGNGTGQQQQQQPQNQQKSPLEQLAQNALGQLQQPQEQPTQTTPTTDLGSGVDAVPSEPTDDGRLRGLTPAEKKPVEASSSSSFAEPVPAAVQPDPNAALEPGAIAAADAARALGGGSAANDPSLAGGGSGEPVRALGKKDLAELEGEPTEETEEDPDQFGHAPPGAREIAGLDGAFEGGLDAEGALSTSMQGFVSPGSRPLSKRGYVQLDAGGAGYRSVGVASRRWGSPALVYGIMRAANRWSEGSRLSIGDMSLEDGGAIYERDAEGKKVAAHKGHKDGLEVDVRALRRSGEQPVSVRDPAYDRDLTQQAIDLFRQELRVEAVWFDDRAIQGAVASPTHADHFHLRIRR